jgi:hypothetical protein
MRSLTGEENGVKGKRRLCDSTGTGEERVQGLANAGKHSKRERLGGGAREEGNLDFHGTKKRLTNKRDYGILNKAESPFALFL